MLRIFFSYAAIHSRKGNTRFCSGAKPKRRPDTRELRTCDCFDASVPLAETKRDEVIEVDPDVDIAAEEENKVINEVHINYIRAQNTKLHPSSTSYH